MDTYNRIDEIRKRKGITWKYLNENIPGKFYRSRMTEFKNGKTTLTTEQLETIAGLLGTSLDYLLGNTDNPQPAGHPASEDTGLNPQEQRLIEIFRELNEQGQEMVADYADTMLRSGKYKKYDKFSLDTKEA